LIDLRRRRQAGRLRCGERAPMSRGSPPPSVWPPLRLRGHSHRQRLCRSLVISSHLICTCVSATLLVAATHLPTQHSYSAPDSGAGCCDNRACLSVCLSVCLSARQHISGTARPTFTRFLCMLPVAVTWSSTGGVAICFVLPVYV